MRDIFSNIQNLDPARIGKAVLRYCHEHQAIPVAAHWQRLLLSSAVPRDHWANGEGLLIARAIDANKAQAPSHHFETIQHLAGVRTLTLLTTKQRGGRLLSRHEAGNLCFAALVAGIPEHDPRFSNDMRRKIEQLNHGPSPQHALLLDLPRLRFGLSIEHTAQIVTQLEAQARRDIEPVQRQAKDMQTLLETGFASPAGQVFNPILVPIRDAVGTRIAALAQAQPNLLGATPVPPLPALQGAGTAPPAPLLH